MPIKEEFWMKTGWVKKAISMILAGAMIVCLTVAAGGATAICAEENAGESTESAGKYVKEVYIAYGKSEEEAAKWLTDNGWEPVAGDFNAGKASKFDDDVAAVMGIKRTDDKYQAVTDMAVMNMKGGYSFPKYEDLLKEKKADINEFVNSFLPVLNEYRANYNGKGSAIGKKRAELAYDMLNKFYDGKKDEPYATANDTGEYLGKLFLDPTRQEGNEKGADMVQIIMESSGAAVIAIETALSMATDLSEESWLTRAAGLTGADLAENLEKYVPEAAGQDVADSAVAQFLSQRFGDAARDMALQWDSVHEEMLWYEAYNEENGLWPADGESDEDNGTRIKEFFDALEKEDPDAFDENYNRYFSAATLYNGMYDTTYEGEWGETLGDFFNPADGTNYGENEDNFLPMAAVLSDGQRAALELMPLSSMILLGFQTEESIEKVMPNVDEMLGEAKEISVYSGINRGIFRGGVALTSEALMESSQGYDPYNDLWSFSGIYNITCYSAAIASVPLMAAGIAMIVMNRPAASVLNRIDWLEGAVKIYSDSVQHEIEYIVEIADYGKDAAYASESAAMTELQKDLNTLNRYNNELTQLESDVAALKPMSMAGRVLTGIGGAILIGAAFMKGYQMYRYYNKTFTQIPTMIVDEADIVTYTKDKDGKDVKNINFDQYVYYQAVRCNRQEIDKISDWQDGVEKYPEWGCGDVADLNGDFGQEWVALYTVKTQSKGDPILADSLKVQYGSKNMPSGCTRSLHLFTYTNAVDLGDTAWSFNNKKKGVYFFWDEDSKAFAGEAASAFSGGHVALAAIGGLLLGIAGATLVVRAKRRKENEPEAA